eukprot:sb/3460675/
MVTFVQKETEEDLQMIESLINDVCRSESFKGWMAFPDNHVSPLYYTPLLDLKLQDVKFSSMITPFELKSHWSISVDPSRTIHAMFEHDIGRLVIFICRDTHWQKIAIHYDELEQHIIQQHCDNSIRMVLFLKNCPRFFEVESEALEKTRRGLKKKGHMVDEKLESKLRLKAQFSRVRSLREDTKSDIPKCSAIELTYPACDSSISRIISGFKKHQFQCFFTRFEDLRHDETAEGDDKIDQGTWMSDLISTQPFLARNTNFIFSLKCLESLGYQFLDKLFKTSPNHKKDFFRFLTERLEEVKEEGVERITQTIYKLVQGFEKDPYLDPCSVFEMYSNKVIVRECDPKSHYQYIKRIIVTPSRFIYVPPEPIAINRILRAHIDFVDNFARVCFRDEDFSQFNVHSDKATENVKVVINEGITIAEGVTFRFLGCSNSQLRSQGLWLFYPQCPHSIESIRDKIGDLSTMKTIQKYVTRMGLAFTATDFSLTDKVEVEEIPEKEIIVGKRRYIFSDGVGCISPAVQDLIIREKYGSEVGEAKPVAFQIRMGGCKGMVAVNPELGDRQVIAILRAQGVPDQSFILLQNRSLIELAEMLTNERLARTELGSMLGMKVGDLKECGLKVTTEPFLRRKLVSLYKFKIRDAITKTRFRIDHRYGRQMKGIMDETGTLQYGEVFVQYSDLTDPTMERRLTLKGDVFVTKNPCLHPGDLQRVIARDVPELRHLYDVIVFPGQGKRPHPNELSGSDLDGDEYFVCWEPKLMPTISCEPAEYYIEEIAEENGEATPPPPEMTEERINKFVFDYITKGSKLGQISNAHAIWADKMKEGVRSDRCIGLAKKHSDAVDFIKTGIAPKFDFMERSLDYPDWMLKPDKTAYHSKTAIGQMFHVVEGLDHHILHRKVGDERIRPSPLFTLHQPPTEQELASATRYYTEYCTDLANIMSAYGIEEEGDIAAGYLNSIKASLAKEHERNYDMREQCLAMFRALQKKTRRAFFHHAGISNLCWREQEDEVLRQAAAWYWVAYNDPPLHQGYSLLSFPWCVTEVLIAIPEVMGTKREDNCVAAVLQDNVTEWYQSASKQGELLEVTLRDTINEVLHHSKGKIRDASRGKYGLIPSRNILLYTEEKDKCFEWVKRSETNNWIVKQGPLSSHHGLGRPWTEDLPDQRPPHLDQSRTTETIQQQQGHISLLHEGEEKEEDTIPTGKRPRRSTASYYIGYLKWVIRGLPSSEGRTLGEEVLAGARKVLTTGKSLKSAMRELHCISYTLSFDTSDTFQALSLRRKSEKKKCYTIAKATSFCNTYFREQSVAKVVAKVGRPVDIKIREAELGGMSALILEMWGDNPQQMNEAADYLQIDDGKFELKGHFLHISHPGYHQLCYIAPKPDISKCVEQYTCVRKLDEESKKDATVIHYITPIYYERHNDIRGVVGREVESRVKAMRDVPLYNPISHGDLTLRAQFGKLCIRKTEGHQFEKKYMGGFKDSKDRELIMRHFLQSGKKGRSVDTWTVFVVFEGLRYKMVFNEDQKLQKVSLEEILWADVMLQRTEGSDLNITLISTHTLAMDRLRHLPLTHATYTGKVGKWFSKTPDGKLSVAEEGVPCYVSRVEVARESIHQVSKQSKDFPFTLHERHMDVYQRKGTGGIELEKLKSYTEVSLEGTLSSLENADKIVKNFVQMSTDLAVNPRQPPGRSRKPSGRGRGAAITAGPSNIGYTGVGSMNLPPLHMPTSLEDGLYMQGLRAAVSVGSTIYQPATIYEPQPTPPAVYQPTPPAAVYQQLM